MSSVQSISDPADPCTGGSTSIAAWSAWRLCTMAHSPWQPGEPSRSMQSPSCAQACAPRCWQTTQQQPQRMQQHPHQGLCLWQQQQQQQQQHCHLQQPLLAPVLFRVCSLRPHSPKPQPHLSRRSSLAVRQLRRPLSQQACSTCWAARQETAAAHSSYQASFQAAARLTALPPLRSRASEVAARKPSSTCWLLSSMQL